MWSLTALDVYGPLNSNKAILELFVFGFQFPDSIFFLFEFLDSFLLLLQSRREPLDRTECDPREIQRSDGFRIGPEAEVSWKSSAIGPMWRTDSSWPL